jgi:large subunit ribosomal protein L25
MDATTFETEPREVGTKGETRSLRLNGRVPGVVYGDGKDQQLISLEARVLRRALKEARFASTLYTLKVGRREVRALPKEVQTHPITGEPIHIDFIRIGRGATVTVTVPVRFIGDDDSPGLKNGGVLNIVRRDVEVTCPADAIPEDVVIDLSSAEINDSLHISQAEIPANVELTITDRDFTVATISPPMMTPEEEDEKAAEEAAEALEGEAEPEAAGEDEGVVAETETKGVSDDEETAGG